MKCLNRWIGPTVVFLLLSQLGGCVPAPPLMSGRDITEEQLMVLTSKPVGKSELLDLLGPPYAIFKAGQKARVQRGVEWNSSGGITMTRSEDVDSKSAFYLFEHVPGLVTDNRVYYYYYSKSSKVGYFMLVAIHEKVENRTEELYVLVNERDGVVVDYFYQGKDEPKGDIETIQNNVVAIDSNRTKKNKTSVDTTRFKNGDVVLLEFNNGNTKEITITHIDERFVVGYVYYSLGHTTGVNYDRRDIKNIEHLE